MTTPNANWRAGRGTAGGPAGPGRGGDAEIDRLALRISGGGEDTARSLGRLVALGLADSLVLRPGQGRIDQLQVQLAAEPGESTQDLAGRIVTRLTEAINQSRGDQA
jgi:hypothetical protein